MFVFKILKCVYKWFFFNNKGIICLTSLWVTMHSFWCNNMSTCSYYIKLLMTSFSNLNKLMNEQSKINRGWSDFTPTYHRLCYDTNMSATSGFMNTTNYFRIPWERLRPQQNGMKTNHRPQITPVRWSYQAIRQYQPLSSFFAWRKTHK